MKNLLLSLLLPSDLKYLEPHLKPARFDQHHVLFEADEQIRYVYFPSLRFQPEKWLKLRWSGSMAWWARPRRSTARWR